MSERIIIIEITESIHPPKVFVDGKAVDVISLNYLFETKTHGNPGEHKLNLVMPDIVDGRFQTQGVAFDRNSKTKKTTGMSGSH